MRHAGVAVLAGGCAALPGVRVADYRDADAAAHFTAFKRDYARAYPSAAEDAHRFRVFKDTMRRAAAEQKLNPDAEFGVNSLSDLTPEEFQAYHSLQWPANRTYDEKAPVYSDDEVAKALTVTVDWTQKGAVTPVKDQKQMCRHTWAFATIANIEGQWFLAGNKLTSLSEQELVSCDKIDDGCGGGLPENAYKWLKNSNSGKVYTESSYPYKSGGGSSGSCSKSGKTVGATITGSTQISGSEGQLATWCSKNGPVAIGVDASAWQSYRSGILSNCGGRSLDHGVTIVGYESGSYWKIKNSWGKSWGDYSKSTSLRGGVRVPLGGRTAKSQIP
eukprot:gene13808-6747_t